MKILPKYLDLLMFNERVEPCRKRKTTISKNIKAIKIKNLKKLHEIRLITYAQPQHTTRK